MTDDQKDSAVSDLLSTKQVAKILRVSVKTVNKWARDGKIPVAGVEAVSGARLYDPEVIGKM